MKKRLITAMMSVVAVFALAVPAFCAEPLDINSVLGTAFEECVASVLSSIGTVLPIALPVMGITIAIGFAIKLFRKLTAKATV